jgi:hypothetical protein
MNFVSGRLARHGRRVVALAGWAVGIPVPFILIFATEWWMVIAANVLLGVQQVWLILLFLKFDIQCDSCIGTTCA